MKYWCSGEVESSIGDSFRKAMNILEEKTNSLLSDKNYDNDDVDSLDVIFIITKGGGKEKIIFKPKSKELDLRVVIDFDKFLKALPNEQILILLNGLLNGLENITKKKNIKHFDILKFSNDLNKIFINDKG